MSLDTHSLGGCHICIGVFTIRLEKDPVCVRNHLRCAKSLLMVMSYAGIEVYR